MEIDFEHLQELSKLKIEDEKKEQFKADFMNILNFVDEITKLELPADEKSEGVKISSLRDDEPKQSDFDALSNAPKQKDGCYQVPLVVE